ncbi:MAG: ribosome maturation factor RimM [Porticoccaceae bacterium]|jgi:16S rRNA processing protein RimM
MAAERPVVKSQPATAVPDDLVVVGKVTTVHGVQGWVKIHSYTEPEHNIFDYQPWWMALPEGMAQIEIDRFRTTAKGFLAHIVGLDDRDQARLYCQRDIQVSIAAFPDAEPGEYYWHQLKGLQVIAARDGGDLLLGTVTGLFDTGANDVMVVRGDAGSHDRLERLIPFVDDYVVDVDVDAGTIRVDWDPDFGQE